MRGFGMRTKRPRHRLKHRRRRRRRARLRRRRRRARAAERVPRCLGDRLVRGGASRQRRRQLAERRRLDGRKEYEGFRCFFSRSSYHNLSFNFLVGADRLREPFRQLCGGPEYGSAKLRIQSETAGNSNIARSSRIDRDI